MGSVWFICAGMVIIMVLFTIFFLVETRNVPIEGVFRLFADHWFWGRHSKIGEVHMAIPEHTRPDADAKADNSVLEMVDSPNGKTAPKWSNVLDEPIVILDEVSEALDGVTGQCSGW